MTLSKITGKSAKPKNMIGWREWCVFAAFDDMAVKAKVDTGAKTSSIHAFDIVPFEENNKRYVSFKIHPLQKSRKIVVACEAELSDYRSVTSSNGEREKRYVIKTPIRIGTKDIIAEVTLTSRHKMAYRMLLGRDAIRKAKFIVDPAKSYLMGRRNHVDTLGSL